jgi:glycosyltransferase involved in cell wall biosynthesis
MRRMKKILMVAPNKTVKGGISTVLKMYLKTDMPYRYDISFLVTHEDGSKFHKFGIMLIGMVRFFFILLTKRVEIVHIHCGDVPSPYRKYIFFTMSRWFKLKVVLHWHGGHFFSQYQNVSGFFKRRLKTLFEKSDVVMCLSQSWSNGLGTLFPDSNRIVVRNGIVPPERTRIATMDSDGPTRIVFLGGLTTEKGFYDLLSVFERLVEEGFDICLAIGGQGDETRLNTRISSPLFKNRVDYLGWIDDHQKERLLQGSDIFVLPSYAEAMPMSILEAMAYGLPVVSTRVGAIPEQVEDGVSGFLLAAGDLEGLKKRIKTLIMNRNLRIQMGRNGRRRIESAFDIRRNYEAICQVYDQLGPG